MYDRRWLNAILELGLRVTGKSKRRSGTPLQSRKCVLRKQRPPRSGRALSDGDAVGAWFPRSATQFRAGNHYPR